MDIWLFILTVLLVALIGAVLISERKTSSCNRLLSKKNQELSDQVIQLKTELLAARAHGIQLEKDKEYLLKELSKTVHLQNQKNEEESLIKTQLAPVKESVKQLTQTLDLLKKEQTQTMVRLESQIKETRTELDDNRKITRELSVDTRALTETLRGTKHAGIWGEQRLRELLQNSGMIRGRDYDLQPILDDSRYRPDAIIHAPGGLEIVIDAKAPLDAFLASVDCESTSETQKLLKKHAQSVRKHIAELGKRAYHNKIDGPKFTLLFLPTEGLLRSAVEEDSNLLSYAFKSNIAIVSPVNLWAVVQTITYLCTQQNLAHSAKEIVRLGESLIANVKSIAQHISELGKSLDKSIMYFNRTVGAVENNLIRTLGKINTLGNEIELQDCKFEAVRQFAKLDAKNDARKNDAHKNDARKNDAHKYTEQKPYVAQRMSLGAEESPASLI
ncbi:DNA recombination protein RmuC [Tropheryma whipplei]|uniref:DNA recombination protein RmuC n=1 Tax=Tropheryma whipplei TaxID=2039 RepID=UPI001F4D168F|nr:DNA recombination protein RmuC [Tropheryma whipplei]